MLEVDCVSKRFGDRTVLKSASLRPVQGNVLALLGRNGAGKSTLLRIAAGIMEPDNGVVRVHGEVHSGVHLAHLARSGVLLLPDRDLLHDALSIHKQLHGVARHFGNDIDVADLAQQMGIAQVLDSKPRQLSGGERRRAEIALALARKPAVLLADEPLRGIAPVDAEVVLSAFRSLAANGSAVVMTGHELGQFISWMDSVTWCVAGTTREFSSVDAALNDFEFRRQYAGMEFQS